MRKRIKDFSISGIAVDQEAIIRLRSQLEGYVVDEMREKGWVPVIDLLPQLYWEFNKNDDSFKYEVIIYGTYVGKKQAKEILGMLDARPIMIESD